MVWQHHRTDDHIGTEDASTIILTEAIGRYPLGTLVSVVLADMAERLRLVGIDRTHGFVSVGLDAWIAPYAGGAGAEGYFGLDAAIRSAIAATFGLDAVLTAPTPVAMDNSFVLAAFFIPREADGISVLTQPVDLDDTVIHVDDGTEFPICPLQIQIGNEVMTVVSGCGTDTLTVERTDPQVHAVGAYVATC